MFYLSFTWKTKLLVQCLANYGCICAMTLISFCCLSVSTKKSKILLVINSSLVTHKEKYILILILIFISPSSALNVNSSVKSLTCNHYMSSLLTVNISKNNKNTNG